MHILLLEDDFVVNGITNTDRKNVYDFLEIYNPEILTLGSVILKSYDKYYLNNNFLQIRGKMGTHAMIYNKDTINELYIKLFNEKIDIDLFTTRNIKIYSYKLPLIIQLFPKTENRNNWDLNIFQRLMNNIFILLFGLDNEKRYKNAYKLLHDIHFKKNYKIIKKIFNAIS